MKKQGITNIILISVLIILCGCDATKELFHGPEPEEPPVVYTVTFDANAASGVPPELLVVNAGTVINLPGSGSLASSGNIFIGWNETANGGGPTFGTGAAITVTKNMTFYAQWLDASTPRYTVLFDPNGASGGLPPASQTVYRNISISLPGQGTLVKSGKIFNGWNTLSDGTGTVYAEGSIFTVEANITLYAQWRSETQYTVTYHPNGAGGDPPPPQAGDSGESISIPSQGGLAYSGKKFNGWNTQANGTGRSYNPGDSLILNSGVTLYAQWLDAPIATYTVSNRTEWTQAVTNFNDSPIAGVYEINLTGSFSSPRVILGSSNSSNSSIAKTLIVEGIGSVRTITREESGDRDIIVNYRNITLILKNNLTLNGGSILNGPMSTVGGNLIMNDGVTITGSSSSNGAVFLSSGSSFTMNGGIITGNTGPGVYIRDESRNKDNTTFDMKGGSITNNSRSGVYINSGTFMMSGGTISDNSAPYEGGGVAGTGIATFTMSGGSIKNNTVLTPTNNAFGGRGGGVYISGTFTMDGGEISGNTVSTSGTNYAYGGGVYIYSGSFTMTGGTIKDNSLSSTVHATYGGGVFVKKDYSLSYKTSFNKIGGGTITATNSATYGKVAFREKDNKFRDAEAGPGLNLSSDTDAGWE
jgi:hypothetical protein